MIADSDGHLPEPVLLVRAQCPSRNRQIWSRSRRAKNITAGIWLIFRGLYFEYNADIGQIGHLWMDTRLAIQATIEHALYLIAFGFNLPEFSFQSIAFSPWCGRQFLLQPLDLLV